MRVGFVQVDGKWPNLALMKLSAWHKVRGDRVDWYAPLLGPYDKVYASKIFTAMPDCEYLPPMTIKGGTGYDVTTKLPDGVESTFPDYGLYPDNDYAMGFTTRGCCRKCDFCFVPRKEGGLHIVGDLYSFWDGQAKVRLLDNNLTAAPMHHFELIMEQLRREKVKVDISQGLDLRLLSDEHCKALKGVRMEKQIRFAWDDIRLEGQIMHGLETFLHHFKAWRAMVFVLIGFDSTEEDDLYRVEKLRSLKVDPFVMPFDKTDAYQRRFARWVNHKAIFKSVAWKDYN